MPNEPGQHPSEPTWRWTTRIDPRVLSRDELRELDRLASEEVGLPSIVLMENAAIGAATHVERAVQELGGGEVAVVAATGNNGGDGLAVARRLHILRCPVRVLLVGDESRLTPDAAVNLGALRLTEIPVDRLESKDEQVAFERVRDWLAEFRPALVVDALLGTGLSRDVEGAPAGVIRAINVARKEKQTSRVVSLDVPSGLDADEGRALGVAVKADATATFAALKRGFFALEAQAYVGEIDLLPIGVPPELTLRFGRPVDTRATACFREEPLRSGQAAPGDPRGAGRDAGGGEPDGSRR